MKLEAFVGRFYRLILFGGLGIAAIVFGFLASRSWGFGESLWSQLFWLSMGTLLTTFVLESLLRRDIEARRRAEGSFHFRVVVGQLLDSLARLRRIDQANAPSLLLAAHLSALTFSERAHETAADIAAASDFDRSTFDRSRGSVGGELNYVGRELIRVYTRTPEEMATAFADLRAQADEWHQYDASLTDRFVEHTDDSDYMKPPERETRRAKTAAAELHAADLVVRTARHLADLAERATRPGQTLSG